MGKSLKMKMDIASKNANLRMSLFFELRNIMTRKSFDHLLTNLYLKVDGVSHELNVAFATKQRNQNG